MSTFSMRLTTDVAERLENLSVKTGRTKAFYVKQALLEHLQDIEDYYMAEKVMERVRKGEERIYTLDEAEHELGLED